MSFDGSVLRAKLPLMPRRRATLVLLMVAASCGKSDSSNNATLRGASTATPDSALVGVSGEWPPDLGAALVIPADTENLAVVMYPATPKATVDPKPDMALFASSGEVVRLKASVSADSAHCGDAPMLRLGR